MNTQTPNINVKQSGCFSCCFNCKEKFDDFCFDKNIRTIKQTSEIQNSNTSYNTSSKLESTSLEDRIGVPNQNQNKYNESKHTKK